MSTNENTDSESRGPLISAELLRNKMAEFFSEEVNRSSAYVDLADIYEACSSYRTIVDKIALADPLSREELWDHLMEIHLELYEHLSGHLSTFRLIIDQMTDEIE